jgi:alpha-glucosidase
MLTNMRPEERLHVRIFDPKKKRYEVPESILPRPAAASVEAAASDLVFALTEKPFSFTVSRRSSGEKLFDTTGSALVYEEQYLHVATNLGRDPNIYGLGEHTEAFRLPHNVNRTLFARDVYGVPNNTDLYGVRPVYFEHRAGGTHGVLLTNSNGMDVRMGTDPKGALKLQYNIIGGIVDFSFVAGPTPNAVAGSTPRSWGGPRCPRSGALEATSAAGATAIGSMLLRCACSGHAVRIPLTHFSGDWQLQCR